MDEEKSIIEMLGRLHYIPQSQTPEERQYDALLKMQGLEWVIVGHSGGTGTSGQTWDVDANRVREYNVETPLARISLGLAPDQQLLTAEQQQCIQEIVLFIRMRLESREWYPPHIRAMLDRSEAIRYDWKKCHEGALRSLLGLIPESDEP